MSKLTVYLADLRHYYLGVLSTDSMPLNVANIKAVMLQELGAEVDARVFVYPETLWKAIQTKTPDVIMFSNYIWNEPLGLHFANMVKSLNPNALTVMGGPNFPIEDDRKAQYMRDHPFLDVYVTGEGDFIASDVLKMYIGSGCDPRKIKQHDIPGAVFDRGDECYIGPLVPRRKDLDAIPSPWLSGIMDEFFDGKLVPLFETNRGCPFTCTFCVQGGRWWSKVNYFDMDRLKEEIFYIARKVKELSPNQKVLRLADLNYGMYERDVQISEWMGECQQQYDWPLLIDATTGKNQADRIIRSIEKVNGALVMYQAVQSLDEDVLLNVKRKNISLDTYEKIQVHVRGRGLRSSSDMILGLPGDSTTSHYSSLEKLLNSGTHQLHNFQAMMLKGAEMDTKASREQYGLQTRFRLLPKNFGRYGGDKVVGVEEIIVSSNTLSFDDYLDARRHHFAIMVFWNVSRFDGLVKWTNAYGYSNWDWMKAVVNEMEHHDGVRGLVHEFMQETKGELFDSREAAEAFYTKEENFQALEANKFGDNLIYKYSALSSFLAWESVCDCAVAATHKLIRQRDAMADSAETATFVAELRTWHLLTHAYGQTAEQIFERKAATFEFDVPAWIAAGSPADFATYRRPAPASFEFALSAENAKNLKAALNVWDYDLKSFSMLVKRVHNGWQIREVIPVGVPTEAGVASAV